MIGDAVSVAENETDIQKRQSDQDQLYRAVGAKIREIRNERGLKQETVAASIGLTRTSLANIEGGRQRLLLHTLFDIASVLDTTVEELLAERSLSLNDIDKTLAQNVTDPDALAFFVRTMRSAPNNGQTHNS